MPMTINSINKVVVRRFKRFGETTFELGDNVVLAGPNNSGKTTLLQAIATWSLALGRWLELERPNQYAKKNGHYAKVPITRQTFYSVPLRAFPLLWTDGKHKPGIEIELTCDGVSIALEILCDSIEQIYVRPLRKVDPSWLRDSTKHPKPVFVPPMSGISIEEPVYQPPKINQLLGQGKTGDVLRNLLLEVSYDSDKWGQLADDIKKMFGYRLLRPNADGASIIVDYLDGNEDAQFDIASAGSGFLQVLMLMAFVKARPGCILLLDEPDAHLHLILQDTIYGILRDAARKSNSQLIIATHSEVVINAVDPRELCAIVGAPTKLVNPNQKETLLDSLKIPNVDILLALEKKCILYLEGHTDLELLRAWAVNLQHPAMQFLQNPYWRETVFEARLQGRGMKSNEHFAALLLATDEMRGVQIDDRDGNRDRPSRQLSEDGKLLKLCWARYEIENYLIHPAALARLVQQKMPDSPLADVDAMREEMREHLPGAIVSNPLEDHETLLDTKMRKSTLPAIFDKAGLTDFPYTRYSEIAEVMQPDEIHPEIIEKLDEIAKHFKLV